MMKSVALLILLAAVATARSTPHRRFNRRVALKQFEEEPIEEPEFEDPLDEFLVCVEECIESTGPEDRSISVCGLLPDAEDFEDPTASFQDACYFACSGAEYLCDGDCPCIEEPDEEPPMGDDEFPGDEEQDEFEICYEECLADVDPEDELTPVCGAFPDDEDETEFTFVDACEALCSEAIPLCEGECPCEIEDDMEDEDEAYEEFVGEIVDRVVEEIVERLAFFDEEIEDPEFVEDDEEFVEDDEFYEDDEYFEEDDEYFEEDEDEYFEEDDEYFEEDDEFVEEDDEFVDEDEYFEEDEEYFEEDDEFVDEDDFEIEEYEEYEEEDDDVVGLTFEDLAALLAERQEPQVNVHIEQVIEVSS